ncbi:hypothetical protein K523DRAFT_126335 [Schizophyllum commune Tattone D]|nr:hypothetical protein K523DRAFT_126335 [Schizophyllum commune Tattone D]
MLPPTNLADHAPSSFTLGKRSLTAPHTLPILASFLLRICSLLPCISHRLACSSSLSRLSIIPFPSPAHHPIPTTLTTSASYFCIIYHISTPYIHLALGDTFRTYIVVGALPVCCAHHCLLCTSLPSVHNAAFCTYTYRSPLVLHRRYRPIVVATSTTLIGAFGSSRSALPSGIQPYLWHAALPLASSLTSRIQPYLWHSCHYLRCCPRHPTYPPCHIPHPSH